MAQNNTIAVTPTTLTFCVAANNSPAPPPQTLTVTANGSTSVGFNANAFPSWIRLNGAPPNTSILGSTGNQPTIAVSIDPSAYNAAGTTNQSGTIQIGANNVLTVPVTVNVSPTCTNGSVLSATPASVPLSNAQNSANITVNGPNTGQITATPQYGTGPAQWFTLSPATPISAGQNITVTLNPTTLTNLASGTTGSIIFSQTGTSNLTVPVTFTASGTGNGVFTATPSTISLTFANTTSAAQTTTVTIDGPSAQLTALANLNGGPAGWLTVAVPPQGLVTPHAILQITVNPAALPVGITSGSVTVSQTNNPANTLTIPVQATVGSGTFDYTPKPLTISVTGGATNPQSQIFTITGPNGAVVTANATVANGGYQWLSVTSGGTLSTTGLQLTASVNPVNLASGQTYNGNIVITQGTATVLNIPVTATTTGNPTLTITPTQVNFAWQTGTVAPSTQSISVTAPTGTQVNFNAVPTTSTCGNNWLVVFPTSPTATPGSVSVSINTAGLPSFTTNCSGNIQITASGASNSSTNIPVNLLVSTSPLLLVSPSSLTFSSQPGSGIPQSQSVQVTSSTPTSPLSFTYNVVPGVSGGPNFLTISQTNTATPATLTIGVNASVLGTLAPGTYVDNVVLTSQSAGNPTITIPVTLTIANTATLVANPSSLVMNYQVGTNNIPPVQTITVSSTGSPVQFSVAASSSCNNFLSVFPTSGNTLSSGQNGTPINVSANVAGLTTPQTCSGTITLTAASTGTPVTIPVTLNVVNKPAINVGVNNITQTAASGSTVPINVNVGLTSTDLATQISFSATGSTTPPGQTWLVVFPQSGFTASNLTVQLIPTNLAPGTYTGSLTINDLTANSPVPTQTIPITFTVAAQATANPSSLTFTVLQNGANPATQTVTVGGIPGSSTISASPTTTSCGTGWLNANASGNTVTVGVTTANISTPAPTTCSGNVTIIVPGALNSPINVPVTVTVTNTALTVTPAAVLFTYPAGSTTTPASQTVQLTATNNATVNFTATATSTNTGLITVSPGSGTTNGATPVPLTIGVNQAVLATLGPGTYQGTVNIASPNIAPQTINVTVTVTQPITPALTSIVNAATQQPGPVAPGEIITIYGNNIGPATPASLTLVNGKVATTLSGVQVLFDNTPAPLIYVSANQINAAVPYEIFGRLQTTVTITFNGITSTGILQRVAETSPGIFTTTQTGSGQAAVLNQNGTVNGAANPAPKGSTISIYATGEGQISPPGTTGSITPGVPPFPKPTNNVTVVFRVPGPSGTTVDIPGTISFFGEAPTLISGVLQVNVVIPAGVPSGAISVVLTVGLNSSPSNVTVQVQ